MRDMRSGHILIGGTGRSGTTLLVRILRRLGLETGFDDDAISTAENRLGRAGLEHTVSRETASRLPMVVKSPHIVDVIESALGEGWLKVDCAILPIRNLKDAADSRRRVAEAAEAAGRNPYREPGSLWKTRKPELQEQVLARQYFHTLEVLVAHRVPVIIPHFPDFAKDAEYFVDILGPYLRHRFDLDADALRTAHRAEVKTDLIAEPAA